MIVAPRAVPSVPASPTPCTRASIRITDYDTSVGVGNVIDLFWVHNVSDLSCSLRGYVRVVYIGSYGIASRDKNPKRLVVRQEDTLGASGNDVGGVERGTPIPTVTLLPKGRASFWIYGTDESHVVLNSHSSRCIISSTMLAWLPGAATSITVAPMRANGFYWCGGIYVHPLVPGVSGSLPARPLTYYFATQS
ncbi:MAG TPA: hypothetical protein VMV11_01700 [Acidimicrobiales bacterium]|nr:hypothetical protein [Acidimicrobiales bacterium]